MKERQFGFLDVIIIGFIIIVVLQFLPGNHKKNIDIAKLNQNPKWTEAAAQSDYVLIYFYSESCGACRSVKPLIYRLADDFSSIYAFLPIDVTDRNNYELASYFNFRYIPGIFLVNNKTGAFQKIEYSQDYEFYKKKLDKFLDL